MTLLGNVLHHMEKKLADDIKAEGEDEVVALVEHAQAGRRDIAIERIQKELDAAVEHVGRLCDQRSEWQGQRDEAIHERDEAIRREKMGDQQQLHMLAHCQKLEADLKAATRQRNEAHQANVALEERVDSLVSANHRLDNDVAALASDRAALQAEVDTLKAELSAATAGKPERQVAKVWVANPISGRIRALEDRYELLAAQFETYCKVTDEKMTAAEDDGIKDFNDHDGRIEEIERRLDALKSI
jgi:chromosome segregation ATPase